MSCPPPAEDEFDTIIVNLQQVEKLFKRMSKGENKAQDDMFWLITLFLKVSGFSLLHANYDTFPFSTVAGGAKQWENLRNKLLQRADYIQEVLATQQERRGSYSQDPAWTPNPGCAIRQPGDIVCGNCETPIPSVIRARVSDAFGSTASIRVQVASGGLNNQCPSCGEPVTPKLYITADTEAEDSITLSVGLETVLDKETMDGISEAAARVRQIEESLKTFMRGNQSRDLESVIIKGVHTAILLLQSMLNGTYQRSMMFVTGEDGRIPINHTEGFLTEGLKYMDPREGTCPGDE